MKKKNKVRKLKDQTLVKNELCRLKKENNVLKKTKNSFRRQTVAVSIIDAPKKRQDLKNKCQNELLTKLSSNLAEFNERNIKEIKFELSKCKGAYGEIRLSKIDFLDTLCAKKLIRGSAADVRAEALILNTLSGHPCFPYFLGF